MSIPMPKMGFHSLFDHLGERFILAGDVIKLLKEDLLYILTHPDEEEFASEYIKNRVAELEANIKMWDKTNPHKK